MSESNNEINFLVLCCAVYLAYLHDKYAMKSPISHKQGNRKGQDTQKNVSEIVCLEECQGLTTALKEGIDIYVNYKTTISTIFNWNLSNDETAIMDRPCQKNC